MFQRERLNGHYGVSAFVISNTISAMPFLMLITFLSGTVCYFMVGLHPGFEHYVFFVLCLYASVTVVESLMMAIASIVPNFLMDIITGAGIQVHLPKIYVTHSFQFVFDCCHRMCNIFWRKSWMNLVHIKKIRIKLNLGKTDVNNLIKTHLLWIIPTFVLNLLLA